MSPLSLPAPSKASSFSSSSSSSLSKLFSSSWLPGIACSSRSVSSWSAVASGLPRALLRLLNKLTAAAYTTHGPDLAVGFRRLDSDRDEKLTWPEFQRVMQRQGVRFPNELGVQVLFELMDTNHSGSVEFSDFVVFMDTLAYHRDTLESVLPPAPSEQRHSQSAAAKKWRQSNQNAKVAQAVACKLAARHRRRLAALKSAPGAQTLTPGLRHSLVKGRVHIGRDDAPPGRAGTSQAGYSPTGSSQSSTPSALSRRDSFSSSDGSSNPSSRQDFAGWMLIETAN